MVVWGGLRPIVSRVLYDAITVGCLSFATFSSLMVEKLSADADKQKKKQLQFTASRLNGYVLLTSLILTVLTAGNFTNRWTLTFPMVPIFILQGLRRIPPLERNRWTRGTIRILCALLILLGIKLSILFPAVELPPIEGPFHVGTIDLHIPVTSQDAAELGGNFSYLPIRILYPTLEEPTPLPYLSPATAIEYCRETMKFGAPDPLKNFGWMLHTWRLTHIQAKEHAQLIPPNGGDSTILATSSEDPAASREDSETQQSKQFASEFEKLPVIVYSHGLGGNADIYSYQTLSLAAKGNVVVVMNHMDGSGPFVTTKCGRNVTFNHDINQMEEKMGDDMRRKQTSIRAKEVLIVTEAALEMNSKDTEELGQAGLSFRGRLEKNHVTAMGHSFGGVTSMTAAYRRPDLYEAIIAHEPATLWMPIEVRKAYFAKSRLGDIDQDLVKGLLDDDPNANETPSDEDLSSFPGIDTLVLFSHEWRQKNWGHCHVFQEMHKEGLLARQGGVAHFGFIEDAHHNEFSDTCMLTPTWLARGVGVTGTRNPLETAREIHERTIAFLQETRARHDILRKGS